MKRYWMLLLAALLLLALACTPSAPASPDATDAPKTAVPETDVPETDVPQTDAPQTTDDPDVNVPTDAPQAGLTFSTIDLNGNTVDQTIFEGYDLIMVNFWAYWCGPCVEEMPYLQKISQEYPNLLLLGVAVDTSAPEETAWTVSDAGVTYPVVYPAGDLLTIANQQQYIPATCFFDANGQQLGDVIVGGRSYEEWTNIVKGLLP